MSGKRAQLPSRSWERGSLVLSKSAILAIMRAVDLIGGMDLESGIAQSKNDKAARAEVDAACRQALYRMSPKPDVCARCGHHKTYHGKKHGIYKASEPCGHIVSCWNDTCGCTRFQGQK